MKLGLRTDWRSLGLFRITFGLACIADVLDRMTNLSHHYTDSGVVPRWIAAEHLEGNGERYSGVT